MHVRNKMLGSASCILSLVAILGVFVVGVFRFIVIVLSSLLTVIKKFHTS